MKNHFIILACHYLFWCQKDYNSEWVSDCFMPNKQFFSYTMSRKSYNKWYDDDVLFVLDQHT